MQQKYKNYFKLTFYFTNYSVHIQNGMKNMIQPQSGTFLLFLQHNQVKCNCTDEETPFICVGIPL